MDSATCHWVCVSAVMDTLEWIAVTKVHMFHYYLSPAKQVGLASQTYSFTSVCACMCIVCHWYVKSKQVQRCV